MSEIGEKTIEEIDSGKEKEVFKKIEAALFISGRWMSLQELITITDLNPILLKQYLDKLKEKYGEDSAIEIAQRDNFWKMEVKQEYSKMINQLATGSSEFTKAEQETLAVIAYKQPVKQSVIIKIRGNKAYDHIKRFRELGMLKVKKVSHTLELNLSEQFYEYFQVNKSKQGEIESIGTIEESGETTETSEQEQAS